MASHVPPPENDGGGASATASRTAWISAVTLSGKSVEERHRWHSPTGVVVDVMLEEVDPPRILRIVGHRLLLRRLNFVGTLSVVLGASVSDSRSRLATTSPTGEVRTRGQRPLRSDLI